MGNPLKGMGGIFNNLTHGVLSLHEVISNRGSHVPAFVDAADYLNDIYNRVVSLVNRKVPQRGRKLCVLHGA